MEEGGGVKGKHGTGWARSAVPCGRRPSTPATADQPPSGTSRRSKPASTATASASTYRPQSTAIDSNRNRQQSTVTATDSNLHPLSLSRPDTTRQHNTLQRQPRPLLGAACSHSMHPAMRSPGGSVTQGQGPGWVRAQTQGPGRVRVSPPLVVSQAGLEPSIRGAKGTHTWGPTASTLGTTP